MLQSKPRASILVISINFHLLLVHRVIEGVQPDIVMIELCKARTNMLHLDDETILEEAKNLNFEKSMDIIKQQGAVQGGMYLALLSMSAHLTRLDHF